MSVPIPVLRSLDEARAREFYIDYLHFTVEWEHRFEYAVPLYMRLRRDRFVLDLSEHHGDGTTGSTVWAPIDDVDALHKELLATGYPRMNPGIDVDSPPAGPLLRSSTRSPTRSDFVKPPNEPRSASLIGSAEAV